MCSSAQNAARLEDAHPRVDDAVEADGAVRRVLAVPTALLTHVARALRRRCAVCPRMRVRRGAATNARERIEWRRGA